MKEDKKMPKHYTSTKRINNQYDAVPIIVDCIINTIHPDKIILFGSCARRCITYDSDIDICIVVGGELQKQEKLNTRALLLEKLLEIIDYDIDLFICSREEWESKHNDPGTFIGKIFKEGRTLYGG